MPQRKIDFQGICEKTYFAEIRTTFIGAACRQIPFSFV